MVYRFDTGEVRGCERTSTGGMRITAALTRTGVLTYRDGKGKEWKEFRPPEAVFSEESLRSLRGATVTNQHPKTLVHSANWREHAVGHVGDDVRRDGDFVLASIVVHDAETVRQIEAGERREVSLGYEAEIEPTPGEWNGERYDAVQSALKNNHAALLPRGAGRAGPEVALRLDGAAVQVLRTDAADEVSTAQTSVGKDRTMSTKLKVGGKEYRADDAGELALAQSAIDESSRIAEASASEVAAIRQALTDAMTKNSTLEGQIAALKAKPEPTEAEQVAALDSKLAVREKLRADARKVLGDAVTLDGKTARQIHEAVVASKMPDTRLDSLSSETVAGMFEALVKTSRNDALAATHAALASPVRTDATEVPDAEAARLRMVERYTNAWTRPASANR